MDLLVMCEYNIETTQNKTAKSAQRNIYIIDTGNKWAIGKKRKTNQF